MENNLCTTSYEKLFEDEDIKIGDVIALVPDENKVTLAIKRRKISILQVIRNLYKN